MKEVDTKDENVIEPNKLNKELSNELIIYKAKEDYFAAALKDQSTRFAQIVTTLFGLLALMSFSWYKYEKKIINEFEGIKNENQILNSRISQTTSNGYIMIAFKLKDAESYFNAMEYTLRGIIEGIKVGEKLNKKAKIAARTGLNSSLNDVEKIIINDEQKAKLIDQKSKILKYISSAQKIDDDEIQNKCAMLRLKINKVT